MALAAEPKLIVADEPTTALDVSIQAQIIQLLKRLCSERGAAVMLITHDMGVIAETCDRVAVMYAGRIAEIGPVHEVIHQPAHPYTAGLMASIPDMSDGPRAPEPDRRRHAAPERHSHAAAPTIRAARAPSSAARERPDLLDAGATRAACWLHDAQGERRHETRRRPEASGARSSRCMSGDPGPGDDLAKTFDVSPPWLNRVLERKPRVCCMRSTA